MNARKIIGREVETASFVRQGASGIDPASFGKRVGPSQRARVVRATRACVMLQRYACGGWHTSKRHGFFVVAWHDGRERSPSGVNEGRVFPPHLVELRILAFGLEARRFFDVGLGLDGRRW